MANRLDRRRQWATAGVGALLLGAAGCAFPNGSTGGDPLLGSFNRPIAPTPPPERGGLGFGSPAYDAGARIGVAPPEYPVAAQTAGRSITLPTPKQLSVARLPNSTEPPARMPVQFATASTDEPAYRLPGPTTCTFPEVPPPVRCVSHAALRDPARVRTMEEAQALLEVLGATAHRADRRENGDWSCSCTVGPRMFAAQAAEPLEAMRLLLEEIEKGR
jgi:hypothetical protein